jgi:hypothetical protein
VSSPLVISMIFGDGGFAGPPAVAYSSDFVEIHNRSTAPQNLNGLSVQYAPAGSTANPSGIVTLSNVALAPGGYYLLAMCTGAPNCGATDTAGASIQPDQTASGTGVNMSFSNGKVFLVNGTTAIPLDATGAPTSAAAPSVLDAVGYGTTGNPAAEPVASPYSSEGPVRSLRPLSAKRGELVRPKRAARNCSAVPSTPKPYFMLRLKLIDEASGK